MDVLFTDIRMPEVDGIQLLRWVHEHGLQCRSIVLSCHDDYSYVRSAFKNDALDYVLKYDIDAKSIRDLLSRALAASSLSCRNRNRLSETAEASRIPSHPDLIARLESLADRLDANAFIRLVWMRADGAVGTLLRGAIGADTAGDPTGEAPAPQELTAVGMEVLMQELGHGKHVAALHPVRSAAGEIVAVLQSAGGDEDSDSHAVYRRVVAATSSRIGTNVSIGVSSLARGGGHLTKLLHEAEQALEQRFYAAPGGVHVYDLNAPHNTVPHPEGLIMEWKARFIRQLTSGEASLLNEWLRDFRKEAARARIERSLVQRLAHELVELFEVFLSERREELGPDERDRLHVGIDGAVFLDDLVQILRGVLVPALATRHVPSERLSVSTGIERALQIIHAEYCNYGFSLADVAALLRYSPSYLSREFKKEVGVGVVAYINSLRLEEARRLLGQGKHYVYEIADLVGFSNYNYFSKLYRKKFGVSPGREHFDLVTIDA